MYPNGLICVLYTNCYKLYYNISMEFIDFSIHNGYENMKIDSDILDDAIKVGKRVPVFRLYGWSPACVSLGRNQREDFVDKEFLHSINVDVVRRLTGGRALLHDNELTYSYVSPADIIPNGENVTESYKYISSIWINIFKTLGIELKIGTLPRHITHNNYCMAVSTGADLCYKGRKFIGSAQCRKQGYILQHGSILIDYNKDFLNKIFKETTDFSTIISLKEINPDITLYALVKAVKTYLESEFQIK